MQSCDLINRNHVVKFTEVIHTLFISLGHKDRPNVCPSHITKTVKLCKRLELKHFIKG